MLFYVLAALINAITSSIIGVVVYFKNRKQAVNRIFAIFCLSVALWSFAYFFWFLLKDKSLILFNHRIFLMGASIFIPILFFHSILAFIEKIKENKKLLIGGYVIFSFFLLVDYFTPFFVKGVEPELFFEFWPKPGIFFHPFLVIWFFYILASVYLLIKEIRILSESREEEAEKKKVQLKYILTGTIIGFGGAAANYFLWYDIPIPPYTNFLVSVGLGIIVYGIIKYQLFNVKVIVSELLVFAIWAFTIIRTVLSKSYEELLINIGFTVLVFIITLLLIRSVYKEVETDKKLLEQQRQLLKEEKSLHHVFEEIAEERGKRLTDAYTRGTDASTRIKIYTLEERIEELEKELRRYQKKEKRKKIVVKLRT